MRRSSAPSQLGLPSKRARFLPPTQLVHNASAENTSGRKDEVCTSEDQTRSVRDVLKLLHSVPNQATGTTAIKPSSHPTIEAEKSNWPVLKGAEIRSDPDRNEKDPPEGTFVQHTHEKPASEISDEKKKYQPRFKPFRTPGTGVSMQAVPPVGSSKRQDSTDEVKPKYFSVVWSKLSKKKHKKWEGDAVLVAKGRSVSLMDMEGKEIGKGSGYKSSELQDLQDGNTLVIGGKEIEIMGCLNEVDFKSGKCFDAAAVKEEVPVLQKRPAVPGKSFVKPGRIGQDLAPLKEVTPAVVSPRHDPSAPKALVLPRPSQTHQFENNRTNSPLVDVVVDPYLSQHLRPHQREGVLFLYECIMGMKNYIGKGAILADEMGLGKTLQCISLIWTLLKQGPYGGKPVAKRVLIVTPGSLVKNWLKEFKKWLGTERLNVYAVTQDSKVDEFVHLPQHPVCIISYEMLVRTIETVRQVNFDLVVCDEGHRLKNSNIKTTTFLNSLPTRRRIILTGTPVQNDLQELYSIVDFCNPAILGTQSAFRRVYEEPILASRQPDVCEEMKAVGTERAMELNRITSMFILRRTSDINNKYLPPKVELVLFCQPSPLQLDLYHQLLHSRVLRSCLASHDVGRHLMCISALKKLCNHPSLLYKNAADEAERGNTEDCDANDLYKDLLQCYPDDFDTNSPLTEYCGKLSVVDQMLSALHQSEPTERVILVSNYTQTLDVLENLCCHREYSFLRLDGQTPTAKRQQLVESFNNRYTHHFVFLLSCKAGGVGLNLIGASRLILYDIDWNPANDLQAMARVWRDGQRQKVFIYRLLSTGTIEEKMYQRQVSKQGLSGVVVDCRSSSTKQCFSPEELRHLFKLQKDTVCATHDLLDCSSCENAIPQSLPGEAISRSCQIQKQPVSQKNLCMDELLEWKHIAGPSPDLSTVDPVMNTQTLDEVTFVFWNKVNEAVKT